MRLWHSELLPYLDNNRIVAQWRELLAIKGTIIKHGTPKSSIVNKVLDYNIMDFKRYTTLVTMELASRGVKYNRDKYWDIMKWECDKFDQTPVNWTETDLYKGWHNDRYLQQCYYNLEEKYDCGAVPDETWNRIKLFMTGRTTTCRIFD